MRDIDSELSKLNWRVLYAWLSPVFGGELTWKPLTILGVKFEESLWSSGRKQLNFVTVNVIKVGITAMGCVERFLDFPQQDSTTHKPRQTLTINRCTNEPLKRKRIM